MGYEGGLDPVEFDKAEIGRIGSTGADVAGTSYGKHARQVGILGRHVRNWSWRPSSESGQFVVGAVEHDPCAGVGWRCSGVEPERGRGTDLFGQGIEGRAQPGRAGDDPSHNDPAAATTPRSTPEMAAATTSGSTSPVSPI